MTEENEMNILNQIDFDKERGLVPAIIQDESSGNVLMLGYLNKDSLEVTLKERKVCFYSRSKKRLWIKGETSGNFLHLRKVSVDCDNDAVLILASPEGPTCHLGSESCFISNEHQMSFLAKLDSVVKDRSENPINGSYTTQLFEKKIHKIAQKIGEEGVEVALAASCESDAELLGESADLIYHLIVLLRKRGLSIGQVVELLESRHKLSLG